MRFGYFSRGHGRGALRPVDYDSIIFVAALKL